jgi:G:T-mismatch repair DNA endonuclease (very short patch repair protein)
MISEITRNRLRESHIGKIPSEETRRKMSESHKGEKNYLYGKHLSEETRKKLSEVRKNPSKERREAISKSLKGRHLSEETKRKMSGKIPWNKGIAFNQIIRDKMSKAHKGKTLSEESRRKLGESRKGERHPFYGKYHSEESKNRMSISAYRRMLDSTKQVFFDTSIEKFIMSELSILDIEFETHKNIYGLPDIFIEPNLCIFCDGTFWHADPKKYTANILVHHNRTAQQIWNRDNKVINILKSQGYEVLRFWENEIESDIQSCINHIYEKIRG